MNAQSRVIKIGHVSPRTGPIAPFGEADPYILDQVQKLVEKGIVSGGRTYPVQIISKDSQSSTSRASEVAAELILRDKVDLLVAASTPDTTNPVADQAEVNEIPCVTTDCPWQPYFFGRNGDPTKGFTWTYHFFWGLEDVIAAFLALWKTAADQQGCRRAVSERRRRQCLGRSRTWLCQAAAGGRLPPDRSRPLPAGEQRLHLADFGLSRAPAKPRS